MSDLCDRLGVVTGTKWKSISPSMIGDKDESTGWRIAWNSYGHHVINTPDHKRFAVVELPFDKPEHNDNLLIAIIQAMVDTS